MTNPTEVALMENNGGTEETEEEKLKKKEEEEERKRKVHEEMKELYGDEYDDYEQNNDVGYAMFIHFVIAFTEILIRMKTGVQHYN